MHETTTRTEYYTSSITLFKKEEYMIGRRSRHDKHIDFLQIVKSLNLIGDDDGCYWKTLEWCPASKFLKI